MSEASSKEEGEITRVRVQKTGLRESLLKRGKDDWGLRNLAKRSMGVELFDAWISCGTKDDVGRWDPVVERNLSVYFSSGIEGF